MKALSIQPPWPYCITHGTKRVENRTWYARYRGLLLIHAGKRYQIGMEYEIHADSPEVDIIGMQQSARGAIVGICRLVDCVKPGEDARLAADQRIWADPEQFKFLLTDVHAFAEPIPYRGELSFFNVPDHVVEVAMQQVRAA
jgi:hypothetical protein